MIRQWRICGLERESGDSWAARDGRIHNDHRRINDLADFAERVLNMLVRATRNEPGWSKKAQEITRSCQRVPPTDQEHALLEQRIDALTEEARSLRETISALEQKLATRRPEAPASD